MGVLRVAIHQPNYLPWLGFFHKIYRSDVFVLLDTVQFARRGYSHRVRVIGPGGNPLWLTQSIQRRPIECHLIRDVIFSDRFWVGKHLKTLRTAYGKAPYFKEVIGLIESCLEADTNHLSICNGMAIQKICRSLNISTELVYASDLDMDCTSSSCERLANIVRHFDGTIYLSGSGARAYNDAAIFSRYGVELTYDDFIVTPYQQRGHEFISGLSVVDALFYLGFNGVEALLKR